MNWHNHQHRICCAALDCMIRHEPDQGYLVTRPLPEIPEGVNFPLKAGNREKQRLCDQHATSLRRLIHAHNHPQPSPEAATKSAEVGRSGTYDTLKRLKMGITGVNGTSLTQAAMISTINEANSIEEIKELRHFPRKEIVIQATLELYYCFCFFLAEKLAGADDLALITDCSTDSHRVDGSSHSWRGRIFNLGIYRSIVRTSRTYSYPTKGKDKRDGHQISQPPRYHENG